MFQLLNTNLYVGPKHDLDKTNNDNWAFVHACKSSHILKLGEQFNTSPYYMMFEEDNHLYINWVDLPDPQRFNWNNEGVKNMVKALDFIDQWIESKKVYVHCDYGQSRSAALVMLYLAIRAKLISPDFNKAVIEFTEIYPDYFSDSGITKFIGLNWGELV